MIAIAASKLSPANGGASALAWIAVVLGGVAFLIALYLQLAKDRYIPWAYWLAVAMVVRSAGKQVVNARGLAANLAS